MSNNPTAAPCPICGPDCKCPTQPKPTRLPPEPPTVNEREERICKLEATIADRDRLIAHIRERYEWLRGVAEDCTAAIDEHCPEEYGRLKKACEEPTP